MPSSKLPHSSPLWPEVTGPLVVLAGIWMLLFNQLQVEWSINSQYSYGYLMPPLAAYLLWLRWKDRPPLTPPAFPKVTLAILGLAAFLILPVRMIQEANPDWRLVSWSLTFSVLILTLAGINLIGGRSWMVHFLFPFAFLLLAVPWPSAPEQWLIQSLMQGVASVTVEGLNWCGYAAVGRGNLIYLPQGVIGVDEACSGVRSLQSSLMASLFIGEIYRMDWKRRGLLFGTGWILALGLNVLRAFFLSLMKVQGGTDLLEKWHDPAGYLILALCFISLLLLARLMHRPADSVETDSSWRPRLIPRSLWVSFLFWLIFCEMATEGWYRLREKDLPRNIAWTLNWPEESDRFHFKKIPEKVQAILRYNEGVSGTLLPSERESWNIFDLVWKPGRAAAQLARGHSPDICLPAAGASLVSQQAPEMIRCGGIELPLQVYIFQNGPQVWQVFYISWEERSRSSAGGNVYDRGNRFLAAWEGRRHLGQRVLEIVVSSPESSEQVQNRIRTFLQGAVRPLP